MTLQDGQRIWASLPSEEGSSAQAWKAIRKSLEGRAYRYEVDPSVTESDCPRNVYQWFARDFGTAQ